MMHQILWIILMAQLATSITRENCEADVLKPMFSTFTPYESVRGQSTDRVEIPKCKPVQFWMMTRHGTRYTDEQGVKNMWKLVDVRDQVMANHDNKTGKLCCKDQEHLRIWTPQTFTTIAMNLAPQGYKDMNNMALRLKSRFPTLLDKAYSPELFEFRFTDHQRTTASAIAFVEGMFGSTHNVRMPQPVVNDELIKPSHHCKSWKKHVGDNVNTTLERKAFDKGPEIAAVVKNVSLKLGFAEELPLEVVEDIYTTCRLEKAWNIDKVAAWCAVFSNDEMDVLTYREDLKHYYMHGDGSEMNKPIGCPPVKDFLLRFSNITHGDKQPLGVFYFSHDAELHHVFTYLGIGVDTEYLTHKNYETMKDRKWKTSLLTPFAGNLAVVFFKCDEGEQYRVQFYLQEKLLELEGCNNTLCNWSYIEEKYGPILEKCDLSFCGH